MGSSRRADAPVWRFLLRFALFSIPLFVVWELWAREPYLAALAQVFAVTGRMAGLDLRVVPSTTEELRFALGEVVWGNRFGMTAVNLVPLAALLLATGDATRWQRMRWLAIGLGLLAATHVLGLWTDILHVQLHTGAPAVANGIRALVTGLGTFVFPLSIWGIFLLRSR